MNIVEENPVTILVRGEELLRSNSLLPLTHIDLIKKVLHLSFTRTSSQLGRIGYYINSGRYDKVNGSGCGRVQHCSGEDLEAVHGGLAIDESLALR